MHVLICYEEYDNEINVFNTIVIFNVATTKLRMHYSINNCSNNNNKKRNNYRLKMFYQT